MKKIILSFLLAGLVFCAHAQSAQKLTEIISVNELTLGNVSYFLAIQTGLCEDDVSEKDAFKALSQAGYFPKDFDEEQDTEVETKLDEKINTPVKIKDRALLCVKAGKIKGGIMYRITKSPRYALRELKAKGLIANDADPSSFVSGRQFLAILTGIEEEKEKAGGTNE